MQRELSREEFDAIEKQVIDQVAKDKPGLKPEEFDPLVDKMVDDAVKLASSTPPKVSGGVVSRWLMGNLRGSPLAMIPALGQMTMDIGANIKRETAAMMDPNDPEPALLHAVKAIPYVGQIGQAIGHGITGQWDRAIEEGKAGNYEQAAAHAVAGALPLVGPGAVAIGERAKSGDVAGAVGEAPWLLASVLSPHIPESATLPIKAFFKNPNAEEAAVISGEMAKGRPIDVGTATGNPTLQTLQRVTGEGMVASVPVARKVAAENAYYKGEAQGLANELQIQGPLREGEVRPTTITPTAAGANARAAVLGKGKAERAVGKEFYGDADMAAQMQEPEWVPQPENFTPSMAARTEHTLGRPTSLKERTELRRILVEMGRGFTKKSYYDKGVGQGGDIGVVGGAAGAKVFDDIVAAMPNTEWKNPRTGQTFSRVAKPERGEVIGSIQRALDTGHYGGAARAAMDVVAERIANPRGQAARNAELPPEAGQILKPMQVPVNVEEAMDALKPNYERAMELHTESGLPMNAGLRAMHEFMTGPKVMEALQLDKVLSNFKNVGRGGKAVRDANVPATPAQAFAFQAESAIEPLLKEKAGTVPGFLENLEAGRASWADMYQTNALLKKFSKFDSEAGLYAKLTGPKGTKYLQELQANRPDAVPALARAKLEMINKLAFNGQTTGPQRAFDQFSKIEPESLNILFPDVTHQEALKNLYQVMALRSKNVNPSGTFLSAAKTKEAATVGGAIAYWAAGMPQGQMALLGLVPSVISGAFGMAFHSTKVAKLLSQGANIPIRNKAAVAAFSRQLQIAVEEAQKQLEEKGDATGVPSSPSGQRDISLPAQGARDPRLQPVQ